MIPGLMGPLLKENTAKEVILSNIHAQKIMRVGMFATKYLIADNEMRLHVSSSTSFLMFLLSNLTLQLRERFFECIAPLGLSRAHKKDTSNHLKTFMRTCV